MIEYNPFWRRFFTREGRLLAKIEKKSKLLSVLYGHQQKMDTPERRELIKEKATLEYALDILRAETERKKFAKSMNKGCC